MMFSPDQPRLRLLHTCPTMAAAYAMRWTRRIVIVSVFGYAHCRGRAAARPVRCRARSAAEGGRPDRPRLPRHHRPAAAPNGPPPDPRPGRRDRPDCRAAQLAGAHLALDRTSVLATLWLAWAVEVPHGYRAMLRYSLSVIVVAAVGAARRRSSSSAALDRMLSPRSELVSRYPGIDTRLALYHPVLVCIDPRADLPRRRHHRAPVLGTWTHSTGWSPAPSVPRLLSSLRQLLVTVLLALAVWEAVNVAFERHLASLTREAQAARSARLRTLLPLLRTTLLITILIVAGMMVLSEIGVNIGPLLAGAGIVGVAIGFGSQKLVQDLITGIFLLLENAMQVGDSVTVSGLSGTVENLSVRTIRLRAGDGSVHIIPFSSVTTVTNVNRGLGNASVSVSVAAHEDTDRVCDIAEGDRRRHARGAGLLGPDAERPAAVGRGQTGRRVSHDHRPSGLHRFRPLERAARIQPPHEASGSRSWGSSCTTRCSRPSRSGASPPRRQRTINHEQLNWICSPAPSRLTASPFNAGPRCAARSTARWRTGRLRGELGRPRSGYLHGRRRALPEAPPRRVRGARR